MNRLLSILKPYFQDPETWEVCVNGIRSLTVFKTNGVEVHTSPFLRPEELIDLCQEFAFEEGHRLDFYSPFSGSNLEEATYRWHCVIPPASPEALFTLRRHKFQSLTWDDFQIAHSTRRQMEELFESPSKHLLFCGPTGSGKTSMLSFFLKAYARDQRVVLIEEFAELALHSPQWISLIARQAGLGGRGEVKVSFLVEQSLRLRPDRIVLGEIRTSDSLAFFETAYLGHLGSASTLHCSQAGGARKRIEFLLATRKESRGFAYANLESLKDLYLIYLERGTPPRVSGVVPF